MRLLLGLFAVVLAVLPAREISSVASTTKELRWCCTSEAEMLKCQDLADVTSREDLSVNVTCVLGSNVTNCVKMISSDNADVITLGEEQIYKAGTEHGLVPVVAEDYGKHEKGLGHYSVALVRANLSRDVSLLSLQGRTSCHPAAGNMVGWRVPVGHLMLYRMIKWKNCSPYESAGEFFEKSCVPGALSKEFNPENMNPTSLCASCTNQNTCPRNASERYYGFHGAYRCLTEGAGDVAFVSHLTVFDYTGVDNHLNPGRDFRLLCPGGTREDVGAFEKCNLARIPSRVVMSRPGEKLAEFKQFLLRIDELFRNNTHLFQMFNSSSYGSKNLLFDDSTVKLIDVKEKNSTKAWLGRKYFTILQTLGSCPKVVALGARSLSSEIRPLGAGIMLFINVIAFLLPLIKIHSVFNT